MATDRRSQLDATAPGRNVPTLVGVVAARQATLGRRVGVVGGESGSSRADIFCR